MNKKLIRCISILVVISIFMFLLTGCNGGNTNDVENQNGEDNKQDVDTTSKDSLIIALGYDASSLDPTSVNDVPSSTIIGQIYEPLIQIDEESGELLPGLAESFEQIDDVTYEFKLKKGVKFHNGEELKASDVKFTFERGIESGAKASIVGQIDESSFNISDDYTISFKIKAPNSSFLPSIAETGMGMVNEKAVTEAGDAYSMNPVGTGPFEFVSWRKGDSIELKRFEEYHGEKPKISEMTFKIIPEATNRVIELESGGVDIACEISPNDVPRVEEHPDLQLLSTTDLSLSYLGFQTEKEPYNDVRVRQAIAYAIDLPSIIQSVWRGVGTVATSPMSSMQKYFNSDLKVREKNIAKAKELLKEAGYPDGFKAKIWTHEHKQRMDIATLIQSELKEVGIDVDIQVLEWGSFLSGLYNGEHEMCILGFFSNIQDPDNSLYQVFHSSLKGSKGNMAYFSNDRVDELLDKGRVLPDSEEREQVYHELQELLVEQAPWIPLYSGKQLVGVRKDVIGFEPSITGIHSFINVSFK